LLGVDDNGEGEGNGDTLAIVGTGTGRGRGRGLGRGLGPPAAAKFICPIDWESEGIGNGRGTDPTLGDGLNEGETLGIGSPWLRTWVFKGLTDEGNGT
jgi:hypothetical protein